MHAAAGTPSTLRGLELLDLQRPRERQRRQQHDIGPLLRHVLLDRLTAGHRPLEPLQRARNSTMPDEQAADPRREPADNPRRPLDIAQPKLGRIGVAGIEIADVVEREPHFLRERKPRLLRRRRRPAPRHIRVLRGEAFDQRLPAEPLGLVRHQVDLMTALREPVDDRLEIAERRKVQRREHDLHAVRRAITRRFLP